MYWQRALVREPRACFQIAGFRFSAATLLTQRDMSGHRFKVGQAVIYLGRDKASGYKITRLTPSEGGDFQYRIRNANEPHDRVVKESDLDRAA